MERKPLYQFSEWFVACLDNLVRDAYTQAEMLEVEKSEARRAIKLAFEILGKKHGIKSSGLNIQLGKQENASKRDVSEG